MSVAKKFAGSFSIGRQKENIREKCPNFPRKNAGKPHEKGKCQLL
jgi:hypothetical protein